MAAVSIVVTEAGGRFTNLDGVDGVAGPGAIATNGRLHEEIAERLALED
jgi:histidinol-phosphatase